jgi:molybdopterin-containing oxidoreductase family membrane subunit
MIVRVAGREIPADPRLAWDAVRQEVMSLPRALLAWLAILGIVILFGAAGAVRSLFPGDKGVATTPSVEWGILIVGYVFFAITTSGLCLASSLGTVFGIERFRPLERRHAILAVLCLVTAFGIIALDLHYPVRMVLGAVFNPSPSSPMWWMGVFYGIYLCFLLTEVWSMFRGHPRIHQVACLLSSCMAIIAPTTLGAVFGVLAARPFWYGAFTPLLMVASAVLSGTALLGMVFWFVQRLHLTGFERAGALAIPAIRMLLTMALLVVACLVARQAIVGLNGSEAGLREATRALLGGPLALPFWGLRVIGGLALPLVILLLPWTRTAAGVMVAACLSIVGVFADRLTFVAAGQIAPDTAASGVVSVPYAAYTPSLVEISILAGAVALVAFLYTLAERYLDLGESEIHAGLLQHQTWTRWRLALRRPVRAIAAGPEGEASIEPDAMETVGPGASAGELVPLDGSGPVRPADVPIPQVARADVLAPADVVRADALAPADVPIPPVVRADVLAPADVVIPGATAMIGSEGVAVEPAPPSPREPAPPGRAEVRDDPHEAGIAEVSIAAAGKTVARAKDPGEAVAAGPVAAEGSTGPEHREPAGPLPPETSGGAR